MRADGVTKLRPWDSVEEMDEAMIDNWNRVVKPGDRVYHLGDVVINRKALVTLNRLNGRKVLIKGNHDIFKLGDYLPYFDDIRGYHILDQYMLAHIPVHPQQLYRWSGQFHGHLHSNRVMLEKTVGRQTVVSEEIDPRYLNLSVEQINFTPVSFDEAKKMMENQ
jgi:calcineurin-like phosphoesterase family protein